MISLSLIRPRKMLRMKMTNNLSKISLSLLAALSLTGCSTLGGVGDALDGINPFSSSEDEGQGEVSEDRIAILELDETLKVTGKITPDQVTLPPAYVNTDWPQVGGNPEHVVQHTAASGNLDKVWSKSIGKGSTKKGRIVSSPVIANGQIFTMDGKNIISSFNEQDGSRLWEYKVSVTERERTRQGKTGIVDRIRDPLSFTDRGGRDKESVGGGVAYGAGKLFVSSGLGVIAALDPQTGEEIWKRETRVPMHSAPTSSGGRVFAVSDDNELFALDADTGEVLWTYQGIVETARMLTAPSPAVVGETVIAPFASGELVALRVQNGGVLWQDALSSAGQLTPLATLNDIAAGPVIADGYVIATAQSGVISAFDLRTGQRVWTQPAGSLGFPLIAGDFVYTVTTDGVVVCLSKLDGTVVWTQQLQAYKNEKKRKKRVAWAGPILAGDRLLVMSSQGKAVVVNPYDGSIINEFKVGDDVFVAPVIANETVYVLTDSAKLIALR